MPLMRIRHLGRCRCIGFRAVAAQLCLNGFFYRLLCWLLDFRRLQGVVVGVQRLEIEKAIASVWSATRRPGLPTRLPTRHQANALRALRRTAPAVVLAIRRLAKSIRPGAMELRNWSTSANVFW